jgi:hypothetical protein
MALTTCAAGLSLAACSAGVTTANSPASSPDTSGTPSSSPAALRPSSPPASTARTIRVDAPVGSFPIPAGAQVVANMPCGKEVLIELSSVTPVRASGFYTSALPGAGYKITDNTLTSDPTTGAAQGMAEITFTGHGYTGLIIALANLGADASASPSVTGLPSSIAKNALEIALTPRGSGTSSTCPS